MALPAKAVGPLYGPAAGPFVLILLLFFLLLSVCVSPSTLPTLRWLHWGHCAGFVLVPTGYRGLKPQ